MNKRKVERKRAQEKKKERKKRKKEKKPDAQGQYTVSDTLWSTLYN